MRLRIFLSVWKKLEVQMFHGVLKDFRKIHPEEIFSSSSAVPDAIFAHFNGSTRGFMEGQVRRLDGSVVKSCEALTSVVYNVCCADSLWKKKLVLTK